MLHSVASDWVGWYRQGIKVCLLVDFRTSRLPKEMFIIYATAAALEYPRILHTRLALPTLVLV